MTNEELWTETTVELPAIGRMCEVMAGPSGRKYFAELIDIEGETSFRSPEGIKVGGVTHWRYRS